MTTESDIYAYLDAKHDLAVGHRFSFSAFIQNPIHNHRWICIYFANPIWFCHRPDNGAVTLQTFLQQPELIISALFNGNNAIATKPKPLFIRIAPSEVAHEY